MNISIYLPDSLKSQMEAYAKRQGISKNATVRRAIELLLQQEQTISWGKWIDDFTDDPAFVTFESYRTELKEPSSDIF